MAWTIRHSLRAAVLAAAALAPGSAAEAATPITSCGYSILSPGSYVLASDISCGHHNEGIYIGASDVNLSLGGHTISAGVNGIRVGNGGQFGDTPERVAITGPGTVQGDGSGAGVVFDEVLSSSVSGITVTGALIGVHVKAAYTTPDSMRNHVSNNKLDGMVNGIKVENAGAIIQDNSCSAADRGAGIFLAPTSARNFVRGNTCNDNYYGIFVLEGSRYNEIHGNTATGNTYDGFDGNDGCATNEWSRNTFATFNQPCVNTDPAPTCIQGTEGNDTLTGTPGDDMICGLGGNDTIRGMGGDDELVGGAGNDTLVGGPGADTLEGGAGSDKASYTREAAGVTVDLASATATDGGGAADVLNGVEHVDGSPFADDLRGNDLVNVLHGLGGGDKVAGAGGADSLFGDGDNDDLAGGDGNDALHPGTGHDTAIGGAGSDRATYGSGIAGGILASLDTGAVTGFGAGADSGNDTLDAVETLVGTPAADDMTAQIAGVRHKLEGIGGDDVLRTADGAGYDSVSGGLGADTCLRDAGDSASSC